MNTRQLFLILACTLIFQSAARADNAQVNVDNFRPSIHRGDFLGVEGAGRDMGGKWHAGGYLTFSDRLFEIVNGNNQHLFSPVTWQLKLDAFFSVRLWKFLSIGVDVPVFLYSSGDSPLDGFSMQHVNGATLGDMRVGLKATIIGREGEGFGLALSEDLSLPTAYPKMDFVGDRLPTGTTMIILDYLKRGWQIAFNIGYRAKEAQKVLDYDVRSQFVVRAGLSAPIICGKLHAFGTLEGRTSGIAPFSNSFENGLDGMLGGRLNIGNLAILAAGGGSFVQGLGNAAYRGTISLAYEPEPYRGCIKDRDHDGVADEKDRCPDVPGDPKLGGCPDRDHDGIIDDEDLCPDEAGPLATRGCPDKDNDGVIDRDDLCPTVPGLKELSGCPDMDGDGITDSDDKCPSLPGPRATQGCPDQDGDGIIDSDDKCPTQPGPLTTQGCPDSDNDGIADMEDKCPYVPGTKELNGCPESKVVITATQIYITEMIFFEFGKARILPASFGILLAVAEAMNGHPSIKLVRVEGHTDNMGNAKLNMSLSKKRAASVVKFLVAHGVDKRRLISEGYGMTRPIADNDTDSGRERNRRVSFMIVEPAPAPQ